MLSSFSILSTSGSYELCPDVNGDNVVAALPSSESSSKIKDIREVEILK